MGPKAIPLISPVDGRCAFILACCQQSRKCRTCLRTREPSLRDGEYGNRKFVIGDWPPELRLWRPTRPTLQSQRPISKSLTDRTVGHFFRTRKQPAETGLVGCPGMIRTCRCRISNRSPARKPGNHVEETEIRKTASSALTDRIVGIEGPPGLRSYEDGEQAARNQILALSREFSAA
jgi:hypothetical protein